MKYKCLQYNIYTNGDYSLVPLREVDIYLIKEWRNEQIIVLRQKKPLTDQDQQNYYKNNIFPSYTDDQPVQIIFSILKEERCIGYGGLTNTNWESKRIELSFLLQTSRTQNDLVYTADFSAYLGMIKDVVFNDLKFNRIFTETYDIRPLHVCILEQNGFIYEGRMREHVLIDGVYYDSLLHGFLKEDYDSKG